MKASARQCRGEALERLAIEGDYVTVRQIRHTGSCAGANGSPRNKRRSNYGTKGAACSFHGATAERREKQKMLRID